jgi:hypothetical protein
MAHMKQDKNPYNRRGEKDTAKAFKDQKKAVKPVAKDTNKTRRPKMKAGEEIAQDSAKKRHEGKKKGY